ncbi:hypothetical protein FACS189449_06260 [Alphaproteobacteria bacterium]|nr:hypothetical protein FACS189449_06260 [Alphaproteobacteria bacterium]
MGDFMNKTMSAIKGAICALSMVTVVSVSAMDKTKDLFDAIWAGKLATAVQLLVDRGADPNGVCDTHGCHKNMPLFLAIEISRIAMVKLLCLAGARLDATNAAKQTPLKYAKACNYPKAWWADRKNHQPQKVVDFLEGFSTAGYLSKVKDESKNTTRKTYALCHAASVGDLEMAIDLAAEGVDPNGVGSAPGSRQNTPIFCAIERGQLAMVGLLCLLGARVNEKNANGQTPLAYARDLNDQRIAYAALERQNPPTDITAGFCLFSTSSGGSSLPGIIRFLESKDAK